MKKQKLLDYIDWHIDFYERLKDDFRTEMDVKYEIVAEDFLLTDSLNSLEAIARRLFQVQGKLELLHMLRDDIASGAYKGAKDEKPRD